jgi:O-antigen/teichoic acid export membrane protein
MQVEAEPSERGGDWTDGLAYWTTRGVWAIVDQALFAGSNLTVNVLLARWLSPREYGAFVTAYAVLLLIGVAHSSLLIEPMMVQGPGRYATRFNEYLSILLRFQLAFGVVAAAVLVLVGAALYTWGAELLGSTFIGLACAAPFIFLSWLVRRACYVERRPATAALGGAVYLFIAGLGAGLLYGLGLLTSMAAQLLMGTASCVSAVVILRLLSLRVSPRTTTLDTRSLWSEHWDYFRWSGASGLFYVAQGLVFYLVLPLWGGLEAPAALRAMTNFVMPVQQSDSALLSVIAPELARVRHSQLSRIVRWATRLFALEGLIFWAVVAFFRNDLVRIVYGNRYDAYADLLILLGALPLVTSRVNILGAALRVHQRVRDVFWAGVPAAAASLLVGFATMPTLGPYGAVTAMIVADVVRIGAMSHFLRRAPSLVATEAEKDTALVGSPRSTPVVEVQP